MNEVLIDPFDVRRRLNQPHPDASVPFDAWPHIGKTVWLDPRRVKLPKDKPREGFPAIPQCARGLKGGGQKATILVHPINDPDFDVELTAGERPTRECREAGIMVRAEIRPVPEGNAIQSFAQILIEKQIPLHSARSFVKRGLKEAGKDTPRAHHPDEQYGALDCEIHRLEMFVTEYLEMGDEGIAKMARGHSVAHRMGLENRLRVLAEVLIYLAQEIVSDISPSQLHPGLQKWLRNKGVTWE